MSLIHWWPLNGDTQDIIGNKHGAIIGTANVTTTGKLGQCLSGMTGAQTTAGVNVADCNLVDELLNSNYSFACWFKVHGTHVHYNGTIMSSGNWNNQAWAVGVSQNNTQIDVFDHKYNHWVNIGYTLTNEKWYHLASVYQNNTSYVYLNGELIGTYSSTPIQNSDASNLTIGRETYAGGYFSFNGDICDVRVYNHALSQSEIKELSRALVIHYTFDDIMAEDITNIVTGVAAGGRTTVDTTNLTVTTTGINQDTYFYLNLSEALVEGETYTIQCIGENIDEDKQFTFGIGSQTSGEPRFVIKTGFNSYTFVSTEKTSGTTKVLFDDTNRSGWEKQATFSQFQITKKDHPTQYVKNTQVGYIYNETALTQPDVKTKINLSNDAASGTYSLKCAGDTYIKHDCVGDASEGATVSFWIKDMDITGQMVVFADYNSKLAFGPYSSYSCLGCQTGYKTKLLTTELQKYWNTSGWNHVVVARDSALDIVCYINGVKMPNTTGDYWTHGAYTTIGCRYSSGYNRQLTGLIDDFRLYHTNLSEEDILQLYKIRSKISNKGDLLCNEFIEAKERAQMKSNYVIEGNRFCETMASGYELLDYIQSSGSQYINTNYYWKNENVKIYMDANVITNSSNQSLFGNEEPRSGGRYFSIVPHGTNGTYGYYVGSNSPLFSGIKTCTIGTRFNMICETTEDKLFIVSVNGTVIKSATYSGTIQAHDNTTSSHATKGLIYIFANHNSSTYGANPCQNVGSMQLYRFIMTDGGKRVRDFIPCRRLSDAAVGLLDLIEGGFYTSPNDVAFEAGNVIENEKIAKILSDQTFITRQIIER